MSDAPRIPHEKALAYAAEPGGTIDVGVNLFVAVARADEVRRLRGFPTVVV